MSTESVNNAVLGNMETESCDLLTLWEAFTDYRVATNRDPAEIRLSPQDWDCVVRSAGYCPDKVPRHGLILGTPAVSDLAVKPGRVRLLCRQR